MAKRLNLATRGFGGEPPAPEIVGLAAWILEYRGTKGDIITYQLARSLMPQAEAGIRSPSAGGIFYGERIRAVISGISDGVVTGEVYPQPVPVIEDAAVIAGRVKGAWCSLPAPHALGLQDGFYQDPDDWNDGFCDTYSVLLRSMRDSGISGHILICQRADERELASLARQTIFFFHPEPGRDDLAALLEHQHQVAVRSGDLPTLFSLSDEYTIRRIFLLDPDPESIECARTHFDPDQIIASGYWDGNDDAYWNDLVASAVYSP